MTRYPETKVIISEHNLLELVHWARRYCNNRLTGAPDDFNRIYRQLCIDNPDLMKAEQSDAHVVKTFPYAEYGTARSRGEI